MDMIHSAEQHENEKPMTAEHVDPAEHGSESKTLQLVMKRKHQQMMLHKMLQDAGYGDLAKMTAFQMRENPAEED